MARVLHAGLTVLLSSGLLFTVYASFANPPTSVQRNVQLAATKCDHDELQSSSLSSRRSFGFQIATLLGVSSAAIRCTVDNALAKSAPELEKDKEQIYKGYERLNYLLDNWVQETTVCGRSGDNPYISKGGCDRTPLKVMDYLGYKNVNDPLFKAEKTFRRLEILVPGDKEAAYLEAVEKWQEAADEGSGIAFVSSWGEANPGGGKGKVLTRPCIFGCTSLACRRTTQANPL